jgi:hypothetical protein
VAGNLIAGELALNNNDGKLYYKNSSGVVTLLASSAGASGDVVGPSSATDNAVARFDLTTGKLIQNSTTIIDDAGNLGIGAAPLATTSLYVAKDITGGVNAFAIDIAGAVQSDVTGIALSIYSTPSVAAGATVSTLAHMYMYPGTFTGTVTSQYGIFAENNMTSATNNYGFYGNIGATTGRWNLYMAGSANNYLAGQLLVGTTTATNGYTSLSPTQSTNQFQVNIGGTNTYAGNPYALYINAALTGTTATTSAAGIFVASAFAVPASGTIASLSGITSSTTFNTTSTVTTYNGVVSSVNFGALAIGNTLTAAYAYSSVAPSINASTTTAITTAAQFNATNIAGTAGAAIGTAVAFYGRQAASNTGVTNNYNLYMSGTANNYLAGSLGIGTTTLTGVSLNVGANIPNSGGYGISIASLATAINSTVRTDNFFSQINTTAAATTFSAINGFFATLGTKGAGSSITTLSGFQADTTLTGGTNSIGFYGAIAAATGRYNLYMTGTADNYIAGGLGIGSTSGTADVPLSVTLVGTAANTNGIRANQTIPATSTSTHKLFQSIATTAASAFTLSNLTHYEAFQSTIGATSAVTSQYGFVAQSNLTGATNNYGFYGAIAAATGRYNLYMAGTASNYLAGNLGIGTAAVTQYNLLVSKNLTGSSTAISVYNNAVIQSDVTSSARYFQSLGQTAAAAFTLTDLIHYYAVQSTIGATSAVTSQYGFLVESNLTGATNNRAFQGNIAAATGAYNLYMSGTAANYLGGNLGIGSTSLTIYNLSITKTITGGTICSVINSQGAVQSDVTSTASTLWSRLSVASGATLTNLFHVYVNPGTFTGTVTTQVGFFVDSNATGATNNYSFYGNIAAATGRWNLYMAGTAANYFGGDMQFDKTVTAAGTTGARTISKNAGTVNFAAAATSLVVTNTLVTTSSIIICTVGTNDTTMKSALAVAAAGSFTIYSNAAATAETRVNFIVIN